MPRKRKFGLSIPAAHSPSWGAAMVKGPWSRGPGRVSMGNVGMHRGGGAQTRMRHNPPASVGTAHKGKRRKRKSRA